MVWYSRLPRLVVCYRMVVAVAWEPEYIVFDLVRIETALNRVFSFWMELEETLLAVKCCWKAEGKPGLKVRAMT